MVRNCLNCHFLCKEHVDADTGRSLTFVLKPNERDVLKKDPVGFDRGWHSLKCHMGVWDEGIEPLTKPEDDYLLSRERGKSCFFILYQPSMLLKAAEELQKRSEENRQLKTSYRYTQIGLWIAGAGLILSGIGLLLNAFHS